MAKSIRAGSFRVAGVNDESMEYTEPVTVTCPAGHSSPPFTYRDDGGADQTADLADLVQWASEHEAC